MWLRSYRKLFVMNLEDYVVVYGLDADGQAIGVDQFEGKGWRNEGEVNSRRVWAKHDIVLELHAKYPSSHFHFTYVYTFTTATVIMKK